MQLLKTVDQPVDHKLEQKSYPVLAEEFFRACAGDWLSQRRYYTLGNGDIDEVESFLTIRFMEQGCPELVHLAQLHQFEDEQALSCGAQVTWESHYTNKSRKPVIGSTLFGVGEDLLYRDRGFATDKPVTADYSFGDRHTMILSTCYNGSSFEEELKLIGSQYRTRQTIIARAGQEQMIIQYLEKRLA